MMEKTLTQSLHEIIHNKVKPNVRRIDEEAYHPLEFFQELGKSGLLSSRGALEKEVLLGGVRLVEETAQTCMTTAFTLWCHLAGLTYLRKCENPFLKSDILPKLESGELLGGTGLSNALKYYAGLERLRLTAKRVSGGYVVSGHLPSVSNLGPRSWFGIIASVDERYRIMAFVPSQADNLVLKEKRDYLGINGSATHACSFRDVFVPEDWIISEQADDFVKQVRSVFLLYQIPLGLGVTEAAIRSIERMKGKQGECNQYLPIQAADLERELQSLRDQTYRLTESDDLSSRWVDLLQLRLAVAYLTSKAVYAEMLHHGGESYLRYCDSSRRLRESYFLLNLTPTVKHLEKLLKQLNA
ncbi:MAG: acyl-CoA dehydrogenase [Bacillus thermozeamaize]|uniref:Acyl-CoA dehydrogenase n=1 Tax=Bacillus thermozeamaize TaxID=230954 RepID=A0A1Y3PRZ4_9BACI|nr:MAG: acyl-CoA dehydrogenase [Bacillus thermozeamaize]